MKPLICEDCLHPKQRDHVHRWEVTSEDLEDMTWWAAERVIGYLQLDDPETDYCDLVTEVAGEIQEEMEKCFVREAQRRNPRADSSAHHRGSGGATVTLATDTAGPVLAPVPFLFPGKRQFLPRGMSEWEPDGCDDGDRDDLNRVPDAVEDEDRPQPEPAA